MEKEAQMLAAVQLGIELKGRSNEWFNQLEEQIRHYLLHDFNRLVSILYRMDVSEAKLRSNIGSMDSARVITTLLVERQIQRIRSRMNEQMSDDIEEEDGEERW